MEWLERFVVDNVEHFATWYTLSWFTDIICSSFLTFPMCVWLFLFFFSTSNLIISFCMTWRWAMFGSMVCSRLLNSNIGIVYSLVPIRRQFPINSHTSRHEKVRIQLIDTPTKVYAIGARLFLQPRSGLSYSASWNNYTKARWSH